VAVFRQRTKYQLQLQLNSKNESDSQGAEINWRENDAAVRREGEKGSSKILKSGIQSQLSWLLAVLNLKTDCINIHI
jgi:hypothetical protein